ncbi:ORF6N domain-containing protein [Paraburkholderia graminis]|uniref:ORF6N domain-containing protein n=1 Tax=Paraburkholderia graminis TaxID=60548 RepID=UPI0038B9605B
MTPENLPAVVWQEANVITTELLAKLYGTQPTNIKSNFNYNKDRFEEGKHFFRLSGKDLREFKENRVSISDPVTNSRAREIMLWTERGAARHAKMLETDQAWDVFEKLEDHYFRRVELSTDDGSELSTVRDRVPLYHGAVDIVVTYRLSFGKAYQAMNWFAGVDGFPRMTKKQALEASGFVRRLLAGDATQKDFERIEMNRAQIKGESPQLTLIGVTIPLIHGRRR